MKKCIIQIPAYNEAKTLGVTLSQLPRELKGIDTVEWLVINDGSTDDTIKVAEEYKVDHIVSFIHNQGLARGFSKGIETCLSLNADIIVNTDADNQYSAQSIQALIDPILAGKSEIVIGERPIDKTEHFSFLKKKLQKLGSSVMRKVSKTQVPDAPSGFRAISRKAAMQINIFNDYTYTLEMIIQAGRKGIPITSVPIETNADLRPSKLVKSIPSYIKKSFMTMIRISNTYNPFNFFMSLGAIPILLGLILGIRWMVLFMGKGQGLHLPSLILMAVLILIGTQICMLALLGDLMSVNRKLLEDIQQKTRKLYFKEIKESE